MAAVPIVNVGFTIVSALFIIEKTDVINKGLWRKK